jgi:hypothetical protein
MVRWDLEFVSISKHTHFYFMLTSHSLRQNLDYIQDAGFTAGTYNFTHNHRDT